MYMSQSSQTGSLQAAFGLQKYFVWFTAYRHFTELVANINGWEISHTNQNFLFVF